MAHLVERRPPLVGGDGQRLVIDVEALEEGAVKLSAHVVDGIGIQAARIADQFKAVSQPLGTHFEFSRRVAQAGLQVCALDLDGVAALEDLRTAEQAVGCQVDQALLTGVELGELLGQLVVEVAGEPLLIRHGEIDFVAHY